MSTSDQSMDQLMDRIKAMPNSTCILAEFSSNDQAIKAIRQLSFVVVDTRGMVLPRHILCGAFETSTVTQVIIGGSLSGEERSEINDTFSKKGTIKAVALPMGLGQVGGGSAQRHEEARMSLWKRLFGKKAISPVSRPAQIPVRGSSGPAPVAGMDSDQEWRFQRELNYLSSPSLEVRWHAIRELGQMGDQRAVKPLLYLLRDADWNIRVRAVEALGLLKEPSAIPQIRPLLKDKEELVQCQAAIALGRLGDQGVVAQLKRFADSGPNSILEKEASEVLAMLTGGGAT